MSYYMEVLKNLDNEQKTLAQSIEQAAREVRATALGESVSFCIY